MTESQFIDKNKNDWKKLEFLLDSKIRNPNELSRLFVKVSSDLSYARTFYPNRSVRLYLNNLTRRVFDSIKVKKEKSTFKEFSEFFQNKLPFEIYQSRSAFFNSLVVFIIAICIGVISSINNPYFPNYILGDEYVAMTEDNIQQGDPMAVYKDKRSDLMFLRISSNNIKVAFLAFILGILGCIGTYIVLLTNGIMLGTFQYFFYSKGLFWTSFLTIWIHGTIEISAIIIAGAAGIVLGNGFLFPRTLTRTTSLQVSAQRALRIVLGTVPLFIIAGMLESYVTRHTEFSDSVRLSIILISFLFILVQWVIHPYLKRHKNESLLNLHQPKEIEDDHLDMGKSMMRSFSQIVSTSFANYRINISSIIKNILFPSVLAFSTFVVISIFLFFNHQQEELQASLFNYKTGGYSTLFFVSALLSINIVIIKMLFDKTTLSHTNKFDYLRQYLPIVFLYSVILLSIFFVLPSWGILLSLIILPPHFIIALLERQKLGMKYSLEDIRECYKESFKTLFDYSATYLSIGIGLILTSLFSISQVTHYIVNFVKWHHVFNNQAADNILINNIVSWALLIFVLPLFYFMLAYNYHSVQCRINAIDLNRRFEKFGLTSEIFEPQ